jgi:hypothetical protein
MQDRDQLDAIIQRMIAAGESDDDIGLVIQSMQTEASHKPAGNPAFDLTAKAPGATTKLRTVTRRENWPTLAAGLASGFTGPLGALRATGIAFGAGAAARGIDKLTDANDDSAGDVLKSMGTDGAIQGALEAGGRGVISAGGRALASGVMRRALGPSKAAGMKYGDLPGQMLDRRALVTPGPLGLQKIQTAREAAQQAKVSAINSARPVSILTGPIRRGAADRTLTQAGGQRLAGMRDTIEPTAAIRRFGMGGSRPDAGLSLQESELAKQALDASNDAAFQAQRMGRRPRLADAERMALAKEIGVSQQAVVPKLKGINQEIRQTMGLENAIRGRLAQPATGIADDLAMGIAPSNPGVLALRALRGPAAMSTIANLINQLSKTGKVAPNAVRALLATSRD